MIPSVPGRPSVTLFCGGRGAATLVRELFALGGVDVSLIINGYDDGYSTGNLRRFIPGMLGPSDFRKNLRHHLDPTAPRDAALLRLLDMRFPHGATHDDFVTVLSALAPERRPPDGAPHRWVADLPHDARAAVAGDLMAFDDHYVKRGGAFDFGDCSLANLVMAGAYLRLGGDFNDALRAVARLFGFPGRLINVNDGQNAVLVALKEDGELLASEAEIVGPQSPSPIERVFLLREPITVRRRAMLQALPAGERRAWLDARSVQIPLNPEAERAICEADLLVYCPGTLHSSLVPTYLTQGLSARVSRSGAAAKVVVMSLREDHDMQAMDATDVIDRTLAALGDVHNRTGVVTHVLFDRAQRESVTALRVPGQVADRGRGRGCTWVGGDLTEHDRGSVHSGPRTVLALSMIHPGLLRQPTPVAQA